jgi:hypothetical protein
MPVICLPVGSDSLDFSQLVSTGYALPANRNDPNHPRRHAQYTSLANSIQPIK